MRPVLSVALLAAALASPALVPTATAQGTAPLTIEQVMADPEWIGPPVEDATWAWDSQHVQYALKRDGSPVRDAFRQDLDGGAATRVADDQRGTLEGGAPVYDAKRQRMAFVRDGNVFIRDLRTGTLTQLTRANQDATQPQFTTDGGLAWRVGAQWFRWWPGGVVAQAAEVKAENDPASPPKDTLRDYQLSVLKTLADDRAKREAVRQQQQAWRSADASRAPATVYLGNKVSIGDSALSPDGRWLLLTTQEKNGDAGASGKMPKYVTESGYEEFQEVRTRVGRNAPLPNRLWLVDLASASARELKFDTLPGVDRDPLAKLRESAGKEPLKGERALRVEGGRDGPAIRWSNDGQRVAVLIRAIDNKDRWIASLDLATADPGKAALTSRHRLTDEAWINWGFNDFGWLSDNRSVWLLSEESGYSHLYVAGERGRARALTSGTWEASLPQLSADGRSFNFLCNRQQPSRYEICSVGTDGGEIRELTALQGVEAFETSPDGRQLLVQYSRSYLPMQLAVVPAAGGNARVLTDTRSAAFKARPWIEPQIVQVPSKHGAGTVWGKYYGPAQAEPGRKYPIVMFVHGAGYLQNVHQRYPAYFREQMFHNLLVQQGYIVLDLDYRGSEGYGRGWRTAIYRNMGHPELDDYRDGLDWLAANKQGDVDHAGIYGGSYGGFMTFMALFRAPGVFKAGAALRPVADWSQYNHEYTSNILNTPELDPEAYKLSSPIEYADGLQDHLLIAHGMIDDNVFYRDSVVMSQKLIELHKDNWEIAPYPLERHGFTRADSWLDEYKRILKLFETNLKP